MAKSEKDFLKDLQLGAKEKASQRFDVIANTKSVVTVDIEAEKAKLDVYKGIEEVAITSEVLETFDHSAAEIDKIKSEEIDSKKSEYANYAELAESSAESLRKQEERASGAYSIDKQIRDARKQVYSSREALINAKKQATIAGRDKSNVLGRMLGRFTGIDMGQDAYRNAKVSLKNARHQYRSSKLSLKKVMAQMEERKESLSEQRAKVAYYKGKMADIEQSIQESKGKISHVNDKLKIHTQSLDSQYQVVQTYLKLKGIKEKVETDTAFRNNLRAQLGKEGDEILEQLNKFKLPANSLVISLKNPLTPEMVASLEGCEKAIDKYKKDIEDKKALLAENASKKDAKKKKIDELTADNSSKEKEIDEKNAQIETLDNEMKVLQAEKDTLQVKAGETSQSISQELEAKKEQLAKMEEDGKKPGDEEYDKLKREIDILGIKRDYILDKERISSIENQIQSLDPLENADQINALDAQRRVILERMTRSPYVLEMNEITAKYNAKDAEKNRVVGDRNALTTKIESQKQEIAKLQIDIKNLENSDENIKKGIKLDEESIKSLETSKQMVALNERIEEAVRTATEPTIVNTLRQIKEEVQKKLQEQLQQRLGKDKDKDGLPQPEDGRED